MSPVKLGDTQFFWAGCISLIFLACGKVTELPSDIQAGVLPTSGGAPSVGGSSNASGGNYDPWGPLPEGDPCTPERKLESCPESDRKLTSRHEGIVSWGIEAVASESLGVEMNAEAQGGAGGEGGGGSQEESFVFSISKPTLTCSSWESKFDGEYFFYQAPNSEYEVYSAGDLCERGESVASGLSDAEGMARFKLSEHTEGLTLRMTATDMSCVVFGGEFADSWLQVYSEQSYPSLCSLVQDGGHLVIK